MSAVLLVKDAPDLAGVIGRELEAAGCRVIRAGDGETALRLYAQHQPDLVILDWISRCCIDCGSLNRPGLDADGAK